jgi:hypothetical protein
MRFPGSGNDYPLSPGGTVLIARVAIDHRAVHPDLPDLSHADFAMGASSAADNPDVPNLQDIGPTPLYPITPVTGHPVFLSDQVDLETLPRWIMPLNGSTWLRIPRASVIDVWVGQVDWTTGSGYTPSPPCNEDVHRYFDRLSGPADYMSTDFYEFLSVHRKTLTVLPDGRVILQDTNTSMYDFVKAAWTPGWIR